MKRGPKTSSGIANCGSWANAGKTSTVYIDSNALFQTTENSGAGRNNIDGTLIVKGADDSSIFRLKSHPTGTNDVNGAGTIDLRGGTLTFGDGTTPCLPVDSNFTLKLNGGLFQAIGSSMHDLNGNLVVNDANAKGYARVDGGWTVKDVGSTSWSGTLEKLSGTMSLNRDGGAVSVAPGALLRISGGIFNAGGTIDPFTDAADPNLHVAVQNNATFNVNTSSKHVAEVSGTGTTTVADGASLTVGSQGDLTQGGLTMGAGSTVTVHGSATIGSGVTVPGVSVLTVDGNLSAGGNFTVEGTASVGGLTRVAGTTTLGFSSIPTLQDVETTAFVNQKPGVSLGGIRPYDANISSSTAVNADMTASHVRHDSLAVGDPTSIAQVTLTIRESDPNFPLAGVSQVRSLDLSIDPLFAGDSNYVLSTLNLTNNALIVKYGGAASPLNDITAMVRVARGDGSWRDPNTNGLTPGLTSSIIDPNYQAVGVFDNYEGTYTEFPVGGLPVDANVVIIKPTWGGDADLDGDVTFLDYGAIDFAYATNNPESGPPPEVLLTGWRNGDFDYDGVITFLDYGFIDFVYATLNPEGGGVSGAAGAVPEPTTMGLLGLGLIALLSRRRRSLGAD